MARKKGAGKLAKAAAAAYEKVKRKAPLGEGGRFKALSKALAAKGARNPDALSAWIMWKKYGKKGGAALIRKGKRH